MNINLKNLIKILWPGAVIFVWSLYVFGTAFVDLTIHFLALVYMMVLPFVVDDVIVKDENKEK